MKNVKKIVAIAIIGIITVAFSGCNMIEKTQAGINNTVVASVNGEKITVGEVEARMKGTENQLKQQYGSNYASNSTAADQLKQAKTQMLDEMVTEDLLLQKAKTLKLVPSDSAINAEVKKQYDSLRSQDQYKKDSDWKAALTQNGFTEEALKAQMRNQVIIAKVTDYMTKNVSVTDKQIQDYYNSNQLKYTEQPNTIDIAHILVKTEAEAKDIKAQLDKGADFASLAKQKSIDTTSGAAGGELGTYDQANDDQSKQLDATFMTAALSLKVGQISAPVQTQYGWHIIKCVDRKDYPVKKLDDVKAQVKDTLLSQAKQDTYQKTLDKWKKAADIKEEADKLS